MPGLSLFPSDQRDGMSWARQNIGYGSPGVFTGMLDVLTNAIPAAYNESLSAISGVATEYGRAAAFTYGAKKADSVDLIGQPSAEAALFRKRADALTPDPLTTGKASSFVFDAARVLSKAATFTVIGGPIAGAGATGLAEGTISAQRLGDRGVDALTAAEVGSVKALTTAASLMIPVAGKTIMQSLGLVAAGGPVSFMAEQAASRAILEHADYSNIAHEFNPLDPMGLALSAAVPGIFAAGVHGVRARLRATDAQVEAARVVQMAGHVDEVNIVRPEAGQANIEALNTARTQMDSGQRVSVERAITPESLGPEAIAARKRIDDAVAAGREVQAKAQEAVARNEALAAATDTPGFLRTPEQLIALRAGQLEAEGVPEVVRAVEIANKPGFLRTAEEKIYLEAALKGNAFDHLLTPEDKIVIAERDTAVTKAAELELKIKDLTANKDATIRDTAKELQDQRDMTRQVARRTAAAMYEEKLAALENQRSKPLETAPQSHQAGQGKAQPAPVDAGTPKNAPAASGEAKAPVDPIHTAASDIAAESPNLRVVDEITGNETTASELMRVAEETYQQNVKDSEWYMAAISCFLRKAA